MLNIFQRVSRILTKLDVLYDIPDNVLHFGSEDRIV